MTQLKKTRTRERPRQDHASKRQDVLMSAAELFAERGKAGVSMRDIASTVGFNMSALYHYFPNKAALYTEVCLWAFEYASQNARAKLFGPGTIKQRLYTYIRSNISLVSENDVAARIIQQEMLMNAGEFADYPSLMAKRGKGGGGASLAEFLEELSPPLLEHFRAQRLAEIIWDLINVVARHRAAHLRLIPRPDDRDLKLSALDEVWIVVCKLLDLDPAFDWPNE